MSSYFETVSSSLLLHQRRWLITGVSGFIGSHLLEFLLNHNQLVVGLDNFSTGFKNNLDLVAHSVSSSQWSNFKFIQGDIRDFNTCLEACNGINFVLHQAALGSVPRSIEDPISTNSTNIDGFLNILLASKSSNVNNFIYAASSSTYGDSMSLPKIESRIGSPLSPYAITKYVNELYADIFYRCYGFNTIGLRYFNVFGPRQDPDGAYAAVIPRWIRAILLNEPVFVNGDGQTSRDFCYVKNVVQANILAAISSKPKSLNQIYNVAVGQRTSLNELFFILKTSLNDMNIISTSEKNHVEFRKGDVLHSQADITKAIDLLGYVPTFSIKEGIKNSLPYYIKSFQ